MRLILVAALIAAGPAIAGQLVLKNESTGAELRLYDTQCTHGETLGLLKEEWRPKFRNARILNSKGHIAFYGCWLEQDGDAIIILSDGGSISLPLAAFSDPSI